MVPEPQPQPIQLSIPSRKDSLYKTRLIVELKTSLPQRPSKEPVAEVVKKATPTIVVPGKAMMTERESKTPKTTSSDLSPWKSTRKKEPFPKPITKMKEEGSSEEVEELELVSSSEEPDSEEKEAEPVTPTLEKKKIKTRTSEQKKSTPIFKTPVSYCKSFKNIKPEDRN